MSLLPDGLGYVQALNGSNRPKAANAMVLLLLIFPGWREPCGSGFTREAGDAESGTGFARVRGGSTPR